MPEVSVVVPTLNRLDLVRRAVGCVLAQEDVDLELLVVIDGSTDGTFERLSEIGDDRLRLIRHERPLGVARARNDGIAEARGRWLAFLDDDDLWGPRKLRRQLDAAQGRDAGFVYSSSAVVDEHLAPVGLDPAPDPDTVMRTLVKHNTVPGGCSNAMALTESVRELGAFDEDLKQLADWDLWLRLTQRLRSAAVPDVDVAYVEHAGGMHIAQAETAARELDYMRVKHVELMERHGIAMGGGAWFQIWLAGGQVLAGHKRAAMANYLVAARRYRSPGALLRAALTPATKRVAERDLNEQFLPLDSPPPWIQSAGAR